MQVETGDRMKTLKWAMEGKKSGIRVIVANLDGVGSNVGAIVVMTNGLQAAKRNNKDPMKNPKGCDRR